jgi:diadenosine tetraphosphate (Ap4A) HIT family hydrolase
MKVDSATTLCPFCTRIETATALAVSSELAAAFEDIYPVSPGHFLIVSRRHVERLDDLSAEELHALWDLVPPVRAQIKRLHAPNGYNIGLNDGAAAGQTVAHVHLHVIPRYAGDAKDPRGGVRWILPDRAAYWDWGRNE